MHSIEAHVPETWNSFLASQQFRPFLQSWEMGEVYREIGQEPIRLEIQEENELIGICFGHIVPARRGRHLSIPYGPVMSSTLSAFSFREALSTLMGKLQQIAREAGCSFIRMSPFLPAETATKAGWSLQGIKPAPLHLLAEDLWYLPLVEPDPWEPTYHGECTGRPFDSAQGDTHTSHKKTAEDIFKNLRATTRNLIRRAEKEGVTITTSDDPIRDLHLFIALHEETRKRHQFTPYTNTFFYAQTKHFSSPITYPSERTFIRADNLTPITSPRCTLYLAHYRGEVIAASMHMHFAGETSYHHGASTQKYRNIPASYLLQWHAIQDAITRNDHIYNFWGIAPQASDGREIFSQEKQPKRSRSIPLSPCKKISPTARHPFAGVTTFKTGFGGKNLQLQHCMDIPLKPTYYITRAFETLRKWRRGF